MQIRKLLLTTDFSDLSRRAFRPTAELARKFGARIDLVHVAEHPLIAGADLAGFPRDKLDESLERHLAALAADPVFAGIETVPHLLNGPGPEAVREFQDRGLHDLVSIASHGRTGLGHLLLGSFAERVLRTARSPVITWRGGEKDAPFAPHRILFPHDLSEPADGALDVVRFFAREFGAEVILFHALNSDLVPAVMYTEGTGLASELPRLWAEAETWSRDELGKFARAELPGLSVRIECSVGSPAAEIARQAEETAADLVIMATHGRTGLRHALAGSVAEGVVRRSPCPVITVRPEDGD